MKSQPAIHEKLANGMRVVLVPCEAESVAVGLFIASGSRHETDATAGISHFLEHMLFKGTPTRSPFDISRAIEGRGGMFNAATGEEGTVYYCHLPDQYLDEAVAILSDMYLNATIAEDEFAREKEVIIEEIRMYDDEPDSVALENLQRGIFPGARLGEPVAGSEKSIVPMTADGLRRYRDAHYRPDNTVAVVVGAFEPARALAALAPLGAVAKPAAVESLGGDPFALPPVESIEVRRDIKQAQLALGYRTFGITDERIFAATLLDGLLGRGMSSRLFQEVREQRGLSYDIASRMHAFADAGMLTITCGCDPDKLAETEATIAEVVDAIVRDGISVEELLRTKDFILGNFRLSHEKVTSKMFYWGNTLLAFGRPVPIEEQVAGLRAVTVAQINETARTIFRAENRSRSVVLPKSAK